MRPYPPQTGAWLVALLLVAASPAPAPALEGLELAELGDGHFTRLFGFDALEAYETRKGQASARYVVMRRWEAGEAEVLIDIREPAAFGKWAVLMLQRGGRSDDMFVFIPSPVRRVVRLNPMVLQQPIFELITLGELRPIAPGELEYRELGQEVIGGQDCVLVEGRPLHRGLGFKRVELAISKVSGFSLRTVYYARGRELRRVLISPADIRNLGGRRLPARRSILLPGDGPPTVVELLNVVVDVTLPERLFTHHALRTQNFPSF